MDNVMLIKPSAEYADEICALRKEFLDSKTRLSGSSSLERFENPHEWIDYCRSYENRATLPTPESVEADEFMLVRQKDNKVLGLINFRRYLNSFLEEFGGHIGYCVRPSEQCKGYAKKMLALCLEKCREYGLEKVLVTCRADNEASRRTILGAGGVYERTTWLESEKSGMQRYWISLNPLKDYYNSHNEDGRL